MAPAETKQMRPASRGQPFWAGGFVTAALSLILLALGTGLGFCFRVHLVSPDCRLLNWARQPSYGL
jgi:hypothetical protein